MAVREKLLSLDTSPSHPSVSSPLPFRASPSAVQALWGDRWVPVPTLVLPVQFVASSLSVGVSMSVLEVMTVL